MSRVRHKKKMAEGGKATFITGGGSPEAKEAEDKTGGFKSGGKTKKLKDGGAMSEKKGSKNLGKMKRGGKMSAGGSPLTAAHKMSKYGDGDRGFQDSGPKGEDTTAE